MEKQLRLDDSKFNAGKCESHNKIARDIDAYFCACKSHLADMTDTYRRMFACVGLPMSPHDIDFGLSIAITQAAREAFSSDKIVLVAFDMQYIDSKHECGYQVHVRDGAQHYLKDDLICIEIGCKKLAGIMLDVMTNPSLEPLMGGVMKSLTHEIMHAKAIKSRAFPRDIARSEALAEETALARLKNSNGAQYVANAIAARVALGMYIDTFKDARTTLLNSIGYYGDMPELHRRGITGNMWSTVSIDRLVPMVNSFYSMLVKHFGPREYKNRGDSSVEINEYGNLMRK